jgi:hypothetical protein
VQTLAVQMFSHNKEICSFIRVTGQRYLLLHDGVTLLGACKLYARLPTNMTKNASSSVGLQMFSMYIITELSSVAFGK